MAAHQAAKRKRVHTAMLTMQREVTAAKKAAGILLGFGHPSQIDLDARLAEIPDDTRGLTARICGDPLPGRSALDRLREAR